MTKQEIITAAAHIIQSEGYDMLTMSSLAQALDVRKASLYYHFDGKEKLIDAIYDHYERECLHLGFSVDFSKDVRTVFSTALAHWKSIFMAPSRSPFISLIQQRREIDERAWDDSNSFRLMIAGQCEAILDNLDATGRLRITSAKLMSLMLSTTLYEGLVSQTIDVDAFVEEFIRTYEAS